MFLAIKSIFITSEISNLHYLIQITLSLIRTFHIFSIKFLAQHAHLYVVASTHFTNYWINLQNHSKVFSLSLSTNLFRKNTFSKNTCEIWDLDFLGCYMEIVSLVSFKDFGGASRI